jgi:hypothetical protein
MVVLMRVHTLVRKGLQKRLAAWQITFGLPSQSAWTDAHPINHITLAMAHPRTFLAPLSRVGACTLAASRAELPRAALLPYQTFRCASQKSKKDQPQKKKKARNTFIQYDLKHAEMFSLVDAMQSVDHVTMAQKEANSRSC